MNKKLFQILFLLAIFASSAMAQRTVTGIVSDASGEALPGATVMIAGTSTGTVTNLSGAFSIEVPNENSILKFSFIGMEGQEAWFDYRRTGLPVLVPGEAAQRQVLPLRYEYGGNEKDFNTDNNEAALSNLEETSYSRGIIDSPWSKPWLIQGTSNPY